MGSGQFFSGQFLPDTIILHHKTELYPVLVFSLDCRNFPGQLTLEVKKLKNCPGKNVLKRIALGRIILPVKLSWEKLYLKKLYMKKLFWGKIVTVKNCPRKDLIVKRNCHLERMSRKSWNKLSREEKSH